MRKEVDYRPYRRGGDLVTAEDTLLAVFTLSHLEYTYTRAEREAIQHACSVVRARLDRERRRACRLGALIAWRSFSADMRDLPVALLHPGEDLFHVMVESDPDFTCGAFLEMRRSLADALAFRAAARERR